MELNKYEIGKRIREARIAKGLSQEKLRDKAHADLSSKQMSQYETGHGDLLSLTNAAKLCEALDISMDYLLYGKKSKKMIDQSETYGEKVVACFTELFDSGKICLSSEWYKESTEHLVICDDEDNIILDLYRSLKNIKSNEYNLDRPNYIRGQHIKAAAKRIGDRKDLDDLPF